jgi:uncharacterized protein YjbI with pentapeptide repeats
VLWGFDLQTGAPVLEQEMWQSIGDMLGKNEVFDSGLPKNNAELLVQGSCFGANGKAVNASKVSVSFGSISKELMVFGDRHWIKSLGVSWGVTEPNAFTEMPVSYAHAFGGKDHTPNPVGKGMDEIDVDGEKVMPLPNIENPAHLIGSPNDKPHPVSLSRTDIMCEQRMLNAGTYDQKYIETRMPGFPDDLNFDYFNDAARDQWVEGYFNGDERYEIHNMNPKHALIRGQIPGVYGRAFVNHQVNGKVIFKEIPTQLDTVWLFPGSKLGVMIHRGTIEVVEDDATDIKQILIANENKSDVPRLVDHYKKELSLRTDPEESYKYIMNSAPLIPEGSVCGFKAMEESSDFPLEMLASSNMSHYTEGKKLEADEAQQKQLEDMKSKTTAGSPERIKIEGLIQQLADAKVNPPELSLEDKKIKAITDKIAPMMKDDPTKLDMAKLNLKAVDELKDYMDEFKKSKEAESKKIIIEQIKEQKKLDVGGELTQQIKQLESSLALMELPPMLPRVDVSGMVSQVKEQEAELGKQLLLMQSMDLPDEQLVRIKEAMNQDSIVNKVRDNLEKAKDGYRAGAHFLDEHRSPHEGQEGELREAIILALKAGANTLQGDYAFVDLSNLDLSGIDLSGAYLEYANLTNTNLSNTNLSKAIMCHANFKNTLLSNANLTDSNLGSIEFNSCVFKDTDLTGATLGNSKIFNTQFERCKMAGKMDMFMKTAFNNASFTDSDMHNNVFIDADVSSCSFSGSNLSESSFINPKMEGTCFIGANLTSVNFINSHGSNVNFKKAMMKNVRFVGGANLVKADFTSAVVSEANMRDCNLEGATFAAADLYATDFSGSNLKDANFEKAKAVKAQFLKADLTFANMRNIDLMEGSMQKAVLSGASLNSANLYSVNFIGCTVGETDFSDAYLENTIFKDWRP